MTITMKNVKLTTCGVVASRGLKKRLRSLVLENQVQTDTADVVIGRCEDCGALLYADDFLTPEPTPEPAFVDEWECLL